MSIPEPLHLVTQRNQPYGSVRRCCEWCGKMCWPGVEGSAKLWTDDPNAWSSDPTNCSNSWVSSKATLVFNSEETVTLEVYQDGMLVASYPNVQPWAVSEDGKVKVYASKPDPEE